MIGWVAEQARRELQALQTQQAERLAALERQNGALRTDNNALKVRMGKRPSACACWTAMQAWADTAAWLKFFHDEARAWRKRRATRLVRAPGCSKLPTPQRRSWQPCQAWVLRRGRAHDAAMPLELCAVQYVLYVICLACSIGSLDAAVARLGLALLSCMKRLLASTILCCRTPHDKSLEQR
jgi:hypothetical protein